MENVFGYLGLASIKTGQRVKRNVNKKYYRMWECDRRDSADQELTDIPQKFESEINQFGYSINNYRRLLPVPWLGRLNG